MHARMAATAGRRGDYGEDPNLSTPTQGLRRRGRPAPGTAGNSANRGGDAVASPDLAHLACRAPAALSPRRRGGDQPQPRNETLIREDIERPPFRCVELHRGRAGRSTGRGRRPLGRAPGDAGQPEQHPDDALPARVPANLATIAVDDHLAPPPAVSCPATETVGPTTDKTAGKTAEKSRAARTDVVPQRDRRLRCRGDGQDGATVRSDPAAPAGRPRPVCRRRGAAPSARRRRPRWPPAPDGPAARRPPGRGSRRRRSPRRR